MRKILGLAVALALSACGSNGQEFVGTWQAPNNAHQQLIIERNGESFIVSEALSRQRPPTKMAATLDKGTLVIAGGIASTVLTINQANGTLLVPAMNGSLEFKRVR